MNLIDHLQEQGYEPDEGHPLHDWASADEYDLIASGIGTVRVCVYPSDGRSVEVHMFDAYMCEEWKVSLSPNTPDSVIIAALEAAEWQLASKRGGPVTPAQAASTR